MNRAQFSISTCHSFAAIPLSATSFILLTLFTCCFFFQPAVADSRVIGLPGIQCTSSGLVCSPTFRTRVRVRRKFLRVRYTAPSTHCSSIKVRFYIDGVLRRTTGAVAPGGSSKLLRIGRLSTGRHRLALQGVGIVGGCNVGTTGSWGGEVEVQS